MMTPTFPDLTLPQLLREQARCAPDRIAVPPEGLRHLEAARFGPAISPRLAHVGLGLTTLGLGEKGHVAVLSETGIEWVLAQLGAGWSAR